MAMRCYSCGEVESIWIHHHRADADCSDRCHSYCRNCDAGLCEGHPEYAEPTNAEEFDLAELVLEECMAMNMPVSFGDWKRRTEDVFGRTMDPIEATTMFDFVAGRVKP